MVRIETTVKNLLMADPVIAGIVDDRGFDKEMRTDGWANTAVSVFDIDKVFLTTLVVTQEEGVNAIGAPRNARRSMIVVWGFSNASDDGYSEVQTLLDRANAVLAANDDEQVIPGVDVHWAASIGPYRDDDGCIGRYDFAFTGIPSFGD